MEFKVVKGNLITLTSEGKFDVIALCMKKINHNFKGLHIGLPHIGAGLAGGRWNTIKGIIAHNLKDMDVTIVDYNGNK